MHVVNIQSPKGFAMRVFRLGALVGTLALAACSKPTPTPEDIAKLARNGYGDGMFEYRIDNIQITDLNCSYREQKYLCTYTQEVTGSYKKPNFSTGKWTDVPYHNKSKSRMTLSMGDKGWIKEFF